MNRGPAAGSTVNVVESLSLIGTAQSQVPVTVKVTLRSDPPAWMGA